MATNFVEMLAKYSPNIGPLEPYSGHIVVADLDNLLQTVRARRVIGTGHLDLVPAHLGKSLGKVNDCLAMKIGGIAEDAINTLNHFVRPALKSNDRRETLRTRIRAISSSC
ncbi:hypothetical protein RRF57_009491 [Xylaria bambusicola]|uniref:Uncharacterized protein n=1 Tax=Xylaria bambusicola TaxID=326684 RepID=A0AAN7UR03_9PEZI